VQILPPQPNQTKQPYSRQKQTPKGGGFFFRTSRKEENACKISMQIYVISVFGRCENNLVD
ncbi:hypothetical protein, partial [Shimia thalassica]|uniref:hypothetical protein n=1 Tax=Shimia thalassica TaxID=1715693 RepID=UPI002736EDD7